MFLSMHSFYRGRAKLGGRGSLKKINAASPLGVSRGELVSLTCNKGES